MAAWIRPLVSGPRSVILAALACGLLVGFPARGDGARAGPGAGLAVTAAATGTPLRNGTALYPRAIRLTHSGAANGRVLVSISMFPNTNGTAGIFQSADDGESSDELHIVGRKRR